MTLIARYSPIIRDVKLPKMCILNWWSVHMLSTAQYRTYRNDQDFVLALEELMYLIQTMKMLKIEKYFIPQRQLISNCVFVLYEFYWVIFVQLLQTLQTNFDLCLLITISISHICIATYAYSQRKILFDI